MAKNIEQLQALIGRDSTAMLDVSFNSLKVISWHNAMRLLLNEDATTLVVNKERQIRSPRLSFDYPVVIVLKNYVKPKTKTKLTRDSLVGKKLVLRRDSYTCAYCGEFGDTIDHIIPKSRGGRSTWGNLVASCFDCNGRKGDLTPREAGLNEPVVKDPSDPVYYDKHKELREVIFQFLS